MLFGQFKGLLGILRLSADPVNVGLLGHGFGELDLHTVWLSANVRVLGGLRLGWPRCHDIADSELGVEVVIVIVR